MVSPFPGMDPYLEGSLWTSFHHELATEIVRQLRPRLRPKYLAFPEHYFVSGPPEVVVAAGSLYPDVGVFKGKASRLPKDGAVALAAPLRMKTVMSLPIPHVHIEIRDSARRKLVTAIEFLSPANKRGEGRQQYLRKRRRFLKSTVHLLEIDLHHRGRRVPMQEPLPQAPYFVFLSRARKRPWTEVWPIAFDQPLPSVPVPLLKGDADVSLDLQEAFDRVYEQSDFDLALDYSKPPEVSLPAEEATWVENHLKTAGLRP